MGGNDYARHPDLRGIVGDEITTTPPLQPPPTVHGADNDIITHPFHCQPAWFAHAENCLEEHGFVSSVKAVPRSVVASLPHTEQVSLLPDPLAVVPFSGKLTFLA